MVNFSADSAGITAYGTTTAAMASELTAAGTQVAAASPAVLSPALGLIGGDFMAAYAAAHAGHLATIGQLSAVLASMSGAAVGSAASYQDTDLGNADALLGAAGEGFPR